MGESHPRHDEKRLGLLRLNDTLLHDDATVEASFTGGQLRFNELAGSGQIQVESPNPKRSHQAR